MNEQELNALAKGMVPFVRKCVIEAITSLEARHIPPELAAQVASAVRLLHESPPLEQRAQPRPPKITRVERDEQGNFLPVYDGE
jgi:hypothetical protein